MKYPLKNIRCFWRNIDKTPTCWVWAGCKTHDGYGIIRINYKNVKAHRMSWEMHYSTIPGDLFVLHKCDNRACVNPEHLYLGTNQDNMNDMKNRGRSLKGQRNPNSTLSDAQVLEIVEKYRSGRTQASLADEYHVDQTTVSRYVLGKQRNENYS